MKRYVHGFLMAQSMFCAIPFPGRVWDEKARPLMLLFLPLIGFEIGFLWMFLGYLCRSFAVPPLIAGLLLSGFPYLATGFIHLDGFMDVTDAVRSCRDLEKRRQILKDSHVGAFSVIGCILLMIAGFACCSSLKEGADLRILIFIPAVSRFGSAMAIMMLRPMSSSQYAGTFQTDIPKTHPILLLLFLTGVVRLGFFVCGKYGLVLLAVILGYLLALYRGFRSLDGMNGDIAGYALTIGELCGCAALALL